MRRAPSRTSASRSSLRASCSLGSEATLLNMRRTSLWTVSKPSWFSQPGGYAAHASPRPRSTTSGYISVANLLILSDSGPNQQLTSPRGQHTNIHLGGDADQAARRVDIEPNRPTRRHSVPSTLLRRLIRLNGSCVRDTHV